MIHPAINQKAVHEDILRKRLKYEAESKAHAKAIDDLIENVLYMNDKVDTLSIQNEVLLEELTRLRLAVRHANELLEKPSVKIIQMLIGPNTQNYQGRLLGLGDNGTIYFEAPVYDKDENLVEGKRQWVEIQIDPPRVK